MTKSVSLDWIVSLRAIATLGVILIHVSSPQVHMSYGKNMEHWWIGNCVDSLVRFAVPVFLMISGATMLGKEYAIVDYYQKRLLRVFIPFLFWLTVYIAYRWLMLDVSQQPSGIEFFSWSLNLFVKEGVSKHFWYVYMILFIYAMIPLVGKVVRKMKNSSLLILLFVWIIVSYLFRKTPMNMYGWTANVEGKFLAYLLYTGYVILGYFLSRFPVYFKNARVVGLILFCGTGVVSAIATCYYSAASQRLDLRMYSYLTLNTILQSVAIFMMFKELTLENKVILWIRNVISDYSLGIYFIHILIIGVFFRNGLRWDMAYPLISLPLLTCLVLVFSIIIIWLVRKLPFGKYVAG